MKAIMTGENEKVEFSLSVRIALKEINDSGNGFILKYGNILKKYKEGIINSCLNMKEKRKLG